MRGTPCQTHQPCRRWRIIPAHAGNSATHPIQTAHQPDHPRACGELMMSLRELSPPDGSSPRMRGTRGVHRGAVHTHRIIPAHAGNSATWLPRARSNTDHPRACGELIPRPGYENSVYGSSPRMRGTPAALPARRAVDRIIPAHAGNSQREGSASRARPDHPRACGELVLTNRLGRGFHGSSPRMRGTLFPKTTINTGFISRPPRHRFLGAPRQVLRPFRLAGRKRAGGRRTPRVFDDSHRRSRTRIRRHWETPRRSLRRRRR